MGVSTMDGADKSAAPDAIRAPQLRVTRTLSRSDEETTLPRMTGDAGLLMSITTSESERCPTT